jgi:Fic family protein
MTDIHIVERVALFHLEFEAIHPFIDGNGRTGRLIINLELLKAGYPPINIKFGDRKNYYDAFTSFHLNSNVNGLDMVTLVGRYLEEELIRYIQIIRDANSIF